MKKHKSTGAYLARKPPSSVPKHAKPDRISEIYQLNKEQKLAPLFKRASEIIWKYKIGLSDCGKYLHEGQLFNENQLRCMLRLDLQREQIQISKWSINYIAEKSIVFAIKNAKKMLVTALDGHREDLKNLGETI